MYERTSFFPPADILTQVDDYFGVTGLVTLVDE